MELPRARNIGQSLALAIASLGLGAYLASDTSFVPAQVLMFSFPPASLWVAIRRAEVNDETPSHASDEVTSFEEITAGLEFDILTKAS